MNTDSEKNTPKGKIEVLFEQKDQSLLTVENQLAEPVRQPSMVSKSIIHFYFCLEGSAVFEFGPHYSREIQRQHISFFFNPDQVLLTSCESHPGI